MSLHLALWYDCKGEIKYEDVCFKYASRETKAIEHINLTIEPGETVAFVGKSGSGKTTIVNLIAYDFMKLILVL